MPKYMLLLHDRPNAFAKASPAEMQRVIQKYVEWGRALKAKKLLVDGKKLTDDPGQVLRKTRDRVLVTDGPYAETRELLGGIFIIKAKNQDAATALALECPHLEYGGAIEVRQVDER